MLLSPVSQLTKAVTGWEESCVSYLWAQYSHGNLFRQTLLKVFKKDANQYSYVIHPVQTTQYISTEQPPSLSQLEVAHSAVAFKRQNLPIVFHLDSTIDASS